ncbi:LysR family transcriptional regulator [Jannaschia seohaensis]|uniref:DNA-binding transcriptional LysR family regulator n=1 Tax=Jannaschia seohaensis TaxID=475081 RepID=A0A2Y9B5N2_9RHOB|nr:LysR family transcriptional regulator [Jannaschia seohaensis]PWJ13794.1 DNA-binding transcriptional LysR family regulator [Jannaschia seohaensis]SSA50307.1 DNA-binding transcriptional regulator, LysR family [Jannaschia seohaensis]
MQNRDLRTLREIARLGSFREAAERLNMTLSAVSMQMKALEAQLDGALFDRSTRPPRLTPLGRRVAEAADEVLAAEDRLRALAGPEAPLAGRFRLGLVASASARLLPDFLQSVARDLPHTRFDLRTGLSEQLEGLVAEGALDAAVVTATGVALGGGRHTLLARDRLILAVPPGEAPLPFLHFAPTTGIGRVIAAELAHRPDLRDAPRIVLDHVETIVACLDAGVGRTVLPEIDLARARQPFDATALDAMRSLVLVTRIGTPLDAYAERLAALLGVRSAISAT